MLLYSPFIENEAKAHEDYVNFPSLQLENGSVRAPFSSLKPKLQSVGLPPFKVVELNG